MENIKIAIFGGVSALGGFLAYMFGGWSTDLATLCIFMIVDFITGLVVAGVFKKSAKTANGALESKAGFKGLCKKALMLLWVLVAHRLDMALGLDFVRTAMIIGFILNELLSIVENTGLMGLPLPSVVTKAIEILKSKTDEK